MTEILDNEEYLKRLLAAPRPNADKVLAFYDHRVGAICRDARLMFAPLDDHLVHRGDGLFEAMKFVDSKLYQLEPHIKRMQRGAEAIGLTPPCTWERLAELVLEVCRASESKNGVLRIFMGRGPGGFKADPSEPPFSTLYLVSYAFSPKPEEYFEKGATAFHTTIPAKQPYLAKIKSVNYLPNVLMKKEANEKGYDFPVCFDANGFLAEGSIENVCLVDQKGSLVAPEFTNSLVGTTLMRGLDLIKDEVNVQFRHVREEELYHAREMMVVGTTIDALGIVRYNGKPIHDVRPGPVTKRLRELLMQDMRENGTPL